jgi:hypothetical protein
MYCSLDCAFRKQTGWLFMFDAGQNNRHAKKKLPGQGSLVSRAGGITRVSLPWRVYSPPSSST